ncbi:serine/arginine repetitive matrix protein 2-like [Ochlerotatus camptorhynchus]|uniref:serine/arginine repetitive matrix protein 2-like n=1 Tax=Ochlerotatus camptorhynchus TaxID=644619 RepID=UPI0031CE5D7E
MSFLRNIRNNLTNSGHRSGKSTKPAPVAAPARSIISERNNNRSGNESERYGYDTYGSRRDSGTSRRGSNSTTLKRDSKYGKESPAPIIVYVDKYEKVKKPAGILRKNTFTKGDREDSGRFGNAISRSDTFTINELEDEKARTSTYTKKKNKDKSPESTVSKNMEHESQENIPVVVDTRTFRKKSLKSSKPVQKVESFMKRVEKSLFKQDSKKNVRKDSNSSVGAYVPQFRDIGINCKLDEEDKQKTRKKRTGSRDSLLETANLEHSSSSQRSYRERSSTPLQHKNRARSASPTKRYATYDRKENINSRDEPPAIPERLRRGHERSSSPFETLELKSKSANNSYLKARQKEIEMGYSTVNKKAQNRSPDQNKSILVNTTRTDRYDPDHGRSYTVTTSTHRVEFDRPPQFRSDTYNTLKEEYEQVNRKPVGIASPRLSTDRPAKHETQQSPPKPPRKDSTELPKYTFGTNLQERRSRFQQFQKSFKKMDDESSVVTVQQSFFVPI